MQLSSTFTIFIFLIQGLLVSALNVGQLYCGSYLIKNDKTAPLLAIVDKGLYKYQTHQNWFGLGGYSYELVDNCWHGCVEQNGQNDRCRDIGKVIITKKTEKDAEYWIRCYTKNVWDNEESSSVDHIKAWDFLWQKLYYSLEASREANMQSKEGWAEYEKLRETYKRKAAEARKELEAQGGKTDIFEYLWWKTRGC